MSSTQITVGFVDGKSNCKVLKPPGGGSSDIFGDEQAMGTPYRTGKNRMQSNIFAEPQNGAPKQADARRVPVPGTGGADSHDRLFGEPNRNFVTSKNNLKSSIPIGDVADGGAKLTNGKTNGHSNGTTNGHANGNGHTNGKGTSENGHTNGNGYASSEAASVRKVYKTSLRFKTYDLTPDSAYSTKSSTMSHASSATNIDNPTYVSNIKSCIGAMDAALNASSHRLATPRARNPVTGNGISDQACRAKKSVIGGGNRKDGNPVTGEGYKSAGAEINTQVPSLNGSMSQLPSTPSHVVNKNRIPPGGYSKGLW